MTGDTGHRRARGGLWTIAACAAILLLVDAAQVAIVEIHLTRRLTGESPWPVTELAALGWIETGLALALSVGLVLYASGDPRGRRWALVSAACPLLAIAARLTPHLFIADFDLARRLVGWLATGAWVVGGLAFARALWLRAREDRLALQLFAAVLVTHLFALLYGELTTPASGFGPGLPDRVRQTLSVFHLVELLGWLFLSTSRLGAFPLPGPAPQAAVRSDRARVFAAAVATALVLAGTGLLAAALWSTRQVGVGATDASIVLGIPLLVGGASALWRLRAGRVPLSAVAIGVVALVLAVRVVLSSAEQPAREVSLETVTVPGLAISLPAGELTQRYAFREVGSLAVNARHLDLGLVQLAWTVGEESPHAGLDEQLAKQGGTFTPFSSADGSLDYDALLSTVGDTSMLHAAWRCPDDARWFTLELSLYQRPAAELRALAERILDTARCDPGSRAAAPPLAIPLSLPAGYRAIDSEPQTAAWEGPAGDSYSIVWSAEASLALALTFETAALLDAYQVGSLADRIVWLDPIRVGDNTRKVGQVVGDDGTRYLVTAWSCYRTGVSVAAFHVGPASLPREPAIEVFRSGGCPPPTGGAR